MKTKHYTALAILAVAAGAFFVVSPPAESAASKCYRKSYKLEGAWVAKVPGAPMQWSYALSPDPSGRRAAMTGFLQVPIRPGVAVPGLFDDLEFMSPLVGEVVMTGPDTGVFSCVWYGLKSGFPFDEVVFIGVNSGEIQFTGPGKTEITHHLAFYAPTSDADGDGIPDPDQAPALCLPSTSIDTRLGLLPPCTPVQP
jgi:hypothetical protein